MPAMSPTMSEGGIASWKVKEGAQFFAGDVLLEIETDKATIDVEAQDDGILAKVLITEGSKNIPVGKNIALLAEEGDDIANIEEPQDTLSASQEPPSQVAPPPRSTPPSATQESKRSSHAPPTHSRPLFPSVHRLLLENNIDRPDRITGTGVRGMLTKGDVLAYLGKASSPTGSFKQSIKDEPKPSQSTTKEDIKLLDGASLRKLIVSSLHQSSLKARAYQPVPQVNFDSIVEDYLPAPIVRPPNPPKAAKDYFEGLL
ncbi:hypothetical protein M378DRAFT_158348 [Amanita muscaria Koide BX008]|uniref:Pyruvate dehydrogenase protein x component n=1 Tax=Amanita muscaria (strain Koide BX008) TaxID=946122 RepID=A0A0C2X333_AMAMK|nr:hypothetical protein M378DRAFT_158348 [Amanita muscaria Koide BX008]